MAPGIDRCRETYGRHWDLRGTQDQTILARLIVDVLQPVVIHLGIVCTQMCVLGNQQVDPEGLAMTEFSLDIADHQVLHGLHVSLENPVGSDLHRLPRAVRTFGSLDKPLGPWRHVRSDGCQLGLVFQGINEPESFGMPMQKGQLWTSTFSLSRLALRCRNGDALKHTTHDHRQIRGSHRVATASGDKWVSVAQVSGHYTAVCGELYGLCVADVVARTARGKAKQPSLLRSLVEEYRQQDGAVLAIGEQSVPAAEKPKEVIVGELPDDSQVLIRSEEMSEQDRVRLDSELTKLSTASDKLWKGRADSKDWDSVIADLSVYRLSGGRSGGSPKEGGLP